VVFTWGAIFHPAGIALAAGLGAALGEVSGYLAGFSGQAVIEKAAIYQRITAFMDKYGGWAILGLSALPNPFFDLAGIAAGATRIPLPKFLFWCWVGETMKMFVFAYAGATSLGNFIR
jgi:uncharacterized membrane protein YdjX (TVP38/TMEM64 family)